jgi:hypothetical protein
MTPGFATIHSCENCNQFSLAEPLADLGVGLQAEGLSLSRERGLKHNCEGTHVGY